MKKSLLFFLLFIFVFPIMGMKQKRKNNLPKVRNVQSGEIWLYKKISQTEIVLYSKKKETLLYGEQYDSEDDIPKSEYPHVNPMVCEFVKNKKRFYFLVAEKGQKTNGE